MLNAIQRLGDRIIGRLVPEVTAEAFEVKWTRDCGCIWDSPGYIRMVAECYPQGCTACYIAGAC